MDGIISRKLSRWLLPTVLILFMLEILLLPLVIGLTYSGRSETPDHVLTYTKGNLVWDSATGIDKNGVARLNFFDAYYDNVKSENGDNVIAPGTAKENIVRLTNKAGSTIRYTAVLYRYNDAELPVEVTFCPDCSADEITFRYTLPELTNRVEVIRAVTGELESGKIKDFDVEWDWGFYYSNYWDEIDTYLGNKDVSDELTVGLYIVVEDDSLYPFDTTAPSDTTGPDDGTTDSADTEPGTVTPVPPPQTSDVSFGVYLAIMIISLIILLLLVGDRIVAKKRKCAR